jgi:biopolymer transport protein ExbB/TolQ
MHVNELAKWMGDATYAFLALNLLWGIYCATLVWRRLASLRFRNDQEQAEFVAQIQHQLGDNDYEAVTQQLADDPRALSQLVLLSVENRDLEPSYLRQVVAERLQRDVLGPLENNVNWILTVVRNGPLLGLFGTVLGMMAAFGRIGMGEKVQPAQIADEISVALICTAMGLGTAIPLGYVASSLNIRIRDLQESLGPTLVRIIDQFQRVGV